MQPITGVAISRQKEEGRAGKLQQPRAESGARTTLAVAATEAAAATTSYENNESTIGYITEKRE